MRRLLIAMTVLFSIHACADDTIDKQTNNTKPQGAQMVKTRAEIFGEKPIYKLRIQAENVEITAKINGVTIYENFSSNKAFALETVNSLIASHNNTMSLMLTADKLSPKARAKLMLEVFAQGKHFILNSIYVDLSQKKITQGSTPPHEYSYDAKKGGLVRDIKGKIEVGKTTVEKFDSYRRDPADGLNITQSFSLPTPFPRWKFLDSPDIIEGTYDYLNEKEHAQLKKSPKIQALYALDKKIRDALRAKQPEKVIDLFQERFEENAHAYYDTPQGIKQGFLEHLRSDVNDPDNELVEHKGDELYFVIEENRKLAWIRDIEFYNKKTKLYSGYPIKYRLNKEGEWVITK